MGAAGGIEPRHGLVEDEQGLVHGEHAREGDEALLASGQGERRPGEERVVDGKAAALERAADERIERCGICTEVARAEGDVVEDGLGEELVLGELRCVPDRLAQLLAPRQVGRVDAGDGYMARAVM